MNLTTPRRPAEVARQMANEIRGAIDAAEAEGYDHEQALHIAVGYVAGKHRLGIERVPKLVDILDRDTDRLIDQLNGMLADARENRS